LDIAKLDGLLWSSVWFFGGFDVACAVCEASEASGTVRDAMLVNK
jgi:hypothetical protein